MLHYLRYFIVLSLLGSFFYTYSINIEPSTIKKALDKKLPMTIKKKGFLLTLKDITIIGIANNVVESKIDATIQMNPSNKFTKFLAKKSLEVHIINKAIPKLNDTFLSFEILSFEINKFIRMKEVKGLLKKKLESIKIPIKKLKKISWFASIKNISFQDNGVLVIYLGISKILLMLLIPLFLLREIGLLLITLYQKFISPRKKYRCAKGELHGDGTCSSITKEAFKKDGFIAGMKAYKASTKECKKAYKTLKKDERRDGTSCDCSYCSGCGGGSGATDTIGSSTSLCDAGALPCDVGSC